MVQTQTPLWHITDEEIDQELEDAAEAYEWQENWESIGGSATDCPPYTMEDDEDFWEEEDLVEYLFGNCTCGWTGSAMFWRGDKLGEQAEREKLHHNHNSEFPQCEASPLIYSM